MKATVSLAVFSAFILSCNSGPSEAEVALKQKELELKERELALLEKQSNTSIPKDSTIQFASVNKGGIKEEESKAAVEKLLGCWAVEENTNLNLQFYRNGEFVMKDYNRSLHEWETIYGKFEIKDESLTLLYNDRAKQVFRFYKSKDFANKYYIKNLQNERYLFVKTACESLYKEELNTDTTGG